MKTALIRFASILVAAFALGACSTSGPERTAGTTIDDAAITAKVKTALIGNPTTKARQINVTTYDGVVQLSGFVDNTDEKSEASKVAREVDGVKSVRNDLEVKPAQ